MNVWTNGWLHEENYTMGYNEKEWAVTFEIKAKDRWQELDSCCSMAKPIQYCKVINLQLK